MAQNTNTQANRNKSYVGLWIGATLGGAGSLIMAVATPFILPALRKYCLPYVPATDVQLENLSRAFKRHARKGSSFLDIGSGDGRICRLCADLGTFSQVSGVELNHPLVLYSRLHSLSSHNYRKIKYHHQDLWRFPLNEHDSLCIFGVESMMGPLEDYLDKTRSKPQIVFACRFPLRNSTLIDEIGSGIDTVWVYRTEK